jgi:hypothetical protein
MLAAHPEIDAVPGAETTFPSTRPGRS